MCVAEKTNNCEAERRISVSEKLMRDWRKAEASRKWKGAHRDSRAIISAGVHFHETGNAT